jgi:hypothetical protein
LDQQVRELWSEYRSAARALYEGSDDRLRVDLEGDSERAWEALVRKSDELTGALSERLPGNGFESGEGVEPSGESGMDHDPDHETVAAVAAAIDAAVAADVLDAAEEEKERARSRGVRVPPLVELAVPDRSESESVQALLEDADGLFPEGEVMRGSAPWPPHAVEKADVAIDRLLKSGTSVVAPCCVGLLTLGVTDLISTIGGFGVLETIVRSVGRRVRFALRLLRSAVSKIVALVGTERLVEAAVDFSTHKGLDSLAIRSGIDKWAVGAVVRTGQSANQVREILASHAPNEANLETRLEDLCGRYDKNMKWGRRYAKSLRFAAPAVVLLGLGPPGAAGVAAANGIGLTYGLFSLSDRLDTNPLVSRVDGVPSRVRRS